MNKKHVHLKKICIENFRSIEKAEINLSPLTLFIGANNSGKTNFIEGEEIVNIIKRMNDYLY